MREFAIAGCQVGDIPFLAESTWGMLKPINHISVTSPMNGERWQCEDLWRRADDFIRIG